MRCFNTVTQGHGRLQCRNCVAPQLRQLDASAKKVCPKEFGEGRGVFRKSTGVANLAGKAAVGVVRQLVECFGQVCHGAPTPFRVVGVDHW